MLNLSQVEKEVLQKAVVELQGYHQRDHVGLEERISLIQGVIYKILTTRPGFYKAISEDSDFLVKNKEKLQPYIDYYQKQKEMLEENLPTASNPAWLQVNCTNFPKNSKQINIKIYKTFNPFELAFLGELPKLYEQLKILGERRKLRISFKIPAEYRGLYAGADNLVIHFSAFDRNVTSEDISEVQKILNEWLCKNSIKILSRYFGRTELAADQIQASFSEYIAFYYAQELLMGKYSPEAVLYGVIQTSQKINFSL